MKNDIVLINGRVITPVREIADGAVVIRGGRILQVGHSDQIEIPEKASVYDLKNSYISPGFIDLHLHGAWGGDVMSASEDELRIMAEGLVKNGVTSFVPTTLSGPMGEIIKAVECVQKAKEKSLPGAEIIGVHVEGPYFSMEQKGAQNPEYIINPEPEEYLPLLDSFPCICRVSLAPELPGSLELGQELKRRGIIASIGHSNATYQEVVKAVENGFSHVTHMFSGMSGLRRINAYRVSGVIEATLLLDELNTEMIADGHHLPPSLMKLILKAKGLENVCVITDSMSAAGLGPGKYNLGGLDVIVEAEIAREFEIPTQENNYVAKLTDRSAFAGSVSTMDKLVRNLVNHVGLNIEDAVKLATLNPAKIQGLSHEAGILSAGMKANVVVFDDNINIEMTFVNGKLLYQRSN